MGKWAERALEARENIREEIIAALWNKIQSKEELEKGAELSDNTFYDDRLKQFYILKIVLGLVKEENKKYVDSLAAKKFDYAVRSQDFNTFKDIVLKGLYQTANNNVLAKKTTDTSSVLEQVETEVDKILFEIKDGEHLILPSVDYTDPDFTLEDKEALKEYMEDNDISAVVTITNSHSEKFNIDSEKLGSNPTFSIHSVGKVFTGILLVKMINDGIISEKDLDKIVDLDPTVLNALPLSVQERLKHVTLKQLMLHQSGLGDYLDNSTGLSAHIEADLNTTNTTPNITSSYDLLKYGDPNVGELGQFQYSNLGLLLVGFAMEKKYQDAQTRDNKTPLLNIDQIMDQFAKKTVGMSTFANKRPPDGQFNALEQRNPQGVLLTDKEKEYITKYVSARYACTAGGYWTTNEDLQKFAQWIQQECAKNSSFKKLLEKHGAEFYREKKQVVEHSGLHADTAHFYTSLRNGTTITVLSDQGKRAASNLVEAILLQTTMLKQPLHSPKASEHHDERRSLVTAFKTLKLNEDSPGPSAKGKEKIIEPSLSKSPKRKDV